jgi:shikimate dehydrogenase
MMDGMREGPRACVIGWPVAHSRSPMIHNYWLRELGLAGSYEHAAVAPEDFPRFLRSFKDQGFAGGNVTLPHKEAAFALCDQVTPMAAKLEAVNTLWFEDGSLCGDNADGAGFLGALDEAVPGWDQRAATALVLGAGGAARAIVHALQTRHIGKIAIANRTKSRAEKIAALTGAPAEVANWAEISTKLQETDLLVNTTSLGMKGQPPLDLDLSPLPAHAVVSDIIYVPLQTSLIRQAADRGLANVGGLGMLLHQAVPGFEHWFGVRPRVTDELRHLVEADILNAT